MRRNPIRMAWEEDRPALGMWLALPGASQAELLAQQPFDYLCIDQQHGLIDYAGFLTMVQAIEGRGPAPITRLPSPDPAWIGKALDAGAAGIVVPMVNSRAEAESVVRACRYPPVGVRSYGPIRASMSLGSRQPPDLAADPVVVVMVESREGLANVDEIAGTPGIDAIYVGPADLALALGLPPDLDKKEPEHVEAVRRIRDACLRHGIAPGIQCGAGAAALRYVDEGFRLVTVLKDSGLLIAGTTRELAAAQGKEGTEQAIAYT